MRILCINANYPGRLGLLAGYLAERGHEVLFAACHSRKGFSLPHVRRVLLKAGGQKSVSAQEPCAGQWQRLLSVAGATLAPLRMLNREFQPHMVLSTSAEGASFFVRRIFPQAFHGFYALLSRSLYGPALETQARVQSLRILDSHNAFIFSDYEKRVLPPLLRPLLERIDPWLDTVRMDPVLAEPFRPSGCGANDEWVCFRVQELDAERHTLCCRLVLELLHRRPRCHVLLDCGDRERENTAWITRLPAALAARLHIRSRQNSGQRRDMLYNAFVYVVPGFPSETVLARLEAMGCGALLMAPPKASATEAPSCVAREKRLIRQTATPPQGAAQEEHIARLTAACDREGESLDGLTASCPLPERPASAAELERPGQNMLPFPDTPPKQLQAIIDALEHQHEYAALRREARESICARFSPHQVIPRHVARLMDCYQHFLACR